MVDACEMVAWQWVPGGFLLDVAIVVLFLAVFPLGVSCLFG